MLAYLAYVACVLALVGLSYGLGYGSGQRHRAAINLSLIERDACERCKYLNRCVDMYHGDMAKVSADMETHYCRQCAVYNTLRKGE